jgi:hypothetical protein
MEYWADVNEWLYQAMFAEDREIFQDVMEGGM